MPIANEDLRHGAAPRKLHHLGPTLGFQVNPDFLDVGDASLAQQLLSANAIRTGCGAVHQNTGSHGGFRLLDDGQTGLSPGVQATVEVEDILATRLAKAGCRLG